MGKPSTAAKRATKRRSTTGRRRTSARRRPPRRRRGGRRWGRTLLKWSAVAAIWSGLVLAGTIAYLAYDLPDIDQVAAAERRPAITVLAANGSEIARYGDLTGRPVLVDELPPHLVQAVLAIEDRRFYSHFGIDPIGVARALLHNLRVGRTEQGGSTITQQLAKNLFLTHERTLHRKVQEAMLAIWLEANYDKDEILAAYLNRVYLGAGTYGVDAAARAYFGVPASGVSLRQAAVLAGLLKAPSRYAPTNAPDLAQARAAVVLDAMVDADFITEADILRTNSLPPRPRRRPAAGQNGGYFADWVVDQVPDFVGGPPQDLIVVTTMEPELQRLAEAVVARNMPGDDGRQAALVAMRPDGAVVAMVGGLSHRDSPFNRASQALRQPGSAFKPVVYLAALEDGLRPNHAVVDAPLQVGDWSPRNFSGRYLGEITATDALVRSANTASVRVLRHIGVDAAVDMARRLGFTTPMNRDLSLALGTSEVRLVELTAAYAAFAGSGQAAIPHAVTVIHDRGDAVLYGRRGDGPGEMARPWHVWELNAMLTQVIERGTGRAARLDRPAAGKTGTSQDHRDAWFVGFTADYVAGVWVGYDDGRPMDGETGGGLPARIWQDFMSAAHRGLPARPVPGFGTVPVTALASPPEEPDRDGLESLLQRISGQ